MISTGRITEHSLSSDEKHKTYTFTLDIPTAAPGVGFAVGHFDTIGSYSSAPFKQSFKINFKVWND